MSKIKTVLNFFSTVAKHPGESIKSVRKMKREIDYKLYCKEEYGISRLPTVDITDFLPEDGIKISPMAFQNGSSISTDYALLKSLAIRIANCNYFEIGSWRGESLLNICDECDTCTSLSLSKELSMKYGVSKIAADQIDFFLKRNNKSNISLIKSNSFEYDFENHGKKHNLIFVDGDHSYNGIKTRR